MFDVILLTACLALKVRNSSVKWVIDAGKESNLSLLQISCVINRMWQHGWHTSVSSWSSSMWYSLQPVLAPSLGSWSRNCSILRLVPWPPPLPSPSTGLLISSSVLDSYLFRFDKMKLCRRRRYCLNFPICIAGSIRSLRFHHFRGIFGLF